MLIFFTILSVCAFIYFIVLTFYIGAMASQNYIWLVLSLLAAFCVWMVRIYRAAPKRIPLWLIVSIHTVFTVMIVVFTITEVLIATNMRPQVHPGLDYVIVLGAKVEEDGSPSKSLKRRLDKAMAYLDRSPYSILVLSGGKGKDEPKSEAQAMADYLVFNGVNPDRLLLEMESGNTYENIVYSVALIERVRKNEHDIRAGSLQKTPDTGPVLRAEDRPLRIGILTADFHLFRARSIAKKQGFTDVSGISASSDPVLFVHLCAREALAIIKDKYLGHL